MVLSHCRVWLAAADFCHADSVECSFIPALPETGAEAKTMHVLDLYLPMATCIVV